MLATLARWSRGPDQARTLEGVERPGIAAYIPTERNVFVLIDAGANVDARPEHMVQYAIMGTVISKNVLGFHNPAVGLMSIGGETRQGKRIHQGHFQIAQKDQTELPGQCRRPRSLEDPVEVVLCDGFLGNVTLKVCEATASAVFHWLKRELTATPIRKLGALLANNAFLAIRNRTNYEMYGGSPLVGVNSVAIIAHGASSALAIKNALRVACEFVELEINPRIVEAIKRYNEENPANAVPPT